MDLGFLFGVFGGVMPLVPVFDFEGVLALFAGLVGFPAFVTVLVNVLKVFGVVKDGEAPKYVAGFNAVGLLALLVALAVVPGLDILAVDQNLAGLASFLTALLGFVVQMGVSKFSYAQIRGVPLIGKSNSDDEAKAAG